MTYRLVARADVRHSRVAARSAVARALIAHGSIAPAGASSFVLVQAGRVWMEIEVELVAQAQDDADTEVGELTTAVSSLHFRVVQPFGEQLLTCRTAAMRIAANLGWELFDPQTNQILSAGTTRNSWRRFG